MYYYFHWSIRYDTWQSLSNNNVICRQHHLLTVNVQSWFGGPRLHDFTKYNDLIREWIQLWRTKSRDKLRDQKYNFTKYDMMQLSFVLDDGFFSSSCFSFLFDCEQCFLISWMNMMELIEALLSYVNLCSYAITTFNCQMPLDKYRASLPPSLSSFNIQVVKTAMGCIVRIN